MMFLAIDTSTLTAGVALLSADALFVRRGRVTSHSDELLQMVSEVVAESGRSVRELAGVICGAGPGSFTGLRIGLSTCKGLALSVGCPLLLISSLEALAARSIDGPCLAVLDAHKGEVYAGVYEVAGGVPSLRGVERVLAPQTLIADLSNGSARTIVGDGVLAYPQLSVLGQSVDEDGSPHPRELIALGKMRLQAGEHTSLDQATPHYIRRSEAEILKDRR